METPPARDPGTTDAWGLVSCLPEYLDREPPLPPTGSDQQSLLPVVFSHHFSGEASGVPGHHSGSPSGANRLPDGKDPAPCRRSLPSANPPWCPASVRLRSFLHQRCGIDSNAPPERAALCFRKTPAPQYPCPPPTLKAKPGLRSGKAAAEQGARNGWVGWRPWDQDKPGQV